MQSAASSSANPGTLKEVFEKSLRLNASRPAVYYRGELLTYRDLDLRSELFAAALWSSGIRTGDRIALLMKNRAEYPVCDLAIIRLGAVKVPLNEMLSARHVSYMTNHSGARALIVGSELLETAREALLDSAEPLRLFQLKDGDVALEPGFEWLDELTPDAAAVAAIRSIKVEPNAPAAIFYTGGTTGQPKGVLHSQQSLVMNLYAEIIESEIGRDDRLLLTTPLPHAAGLFLESALLRGAVAFVTTRFDPRTVLGLISSESITWTFAVPTMIYRLLDVVGEQDIDLSSLRTIVYGAAPITRERLQAALEVFGPVFIQLYGQTECPNWGTRLSKEDHLMTSGRDDILASCGQASIMADVKIVDDKGNDLPIGQPGEVCLRAPYLLESYYRDPKATAEKFLGDWIRTGDIGLLDPDGYLFLKDRRADMIISGGMNVYSTEVENALQECPGVAQAAVVGVPDPDWGEAVLFVIVRSDPNLAEVSVLEHCRKLLAKYSQPKAVVFVDQLPVTPYGKIDKKSLRRSYWAGQERAIH